MDSRLGGGVWKNTILLKQSSWNDYGYLTSFWVYFCDEDGYRKELGEIKIGYIGQEVGRHTSEELFLESNVIQKLPEKFFSLSPDCDFYKKLAATFSDNERTLILTALRDVVNDINIYEAFKAEGVMTTSLMRGLSEQLLKGQFLRVLNGLAELTEYEFSFKRSESEALSSVQVSFHVVPNSSPQTNIHALIGKNGVGKSSLLRSFIDAMSKKSNCELLVKDDARKFYRSSDYKYFGNIVYISFSAFDSFNITDVSSSSEGSIFYVGLKTVSADGLITTKDSEELRREVVDSISTCLSISRDREFWKEAVQRLEFDSSFKEIGLSNLVDEYLDDFHEIKPRLESKVRCLSSGHLVVLMMLSKLVELVEEKTLVLIDEPECHLQPPLLSSLIRVISDLMMNKNGVAILVTHSPVVLQEVPRSCVWLIDRRGRLMNAIRPNIETYGENVGVLTKEVFGLELYSSGFYSLLKKSAESGRKYEEIVKEYGDQLGLEARLLLKTFVTSRDE